MAAITATAFKAAVATAATNLTTALNDDTLTGVALPFQHPSHPLRKIEKLFDFNPVTGAITANDDYIDAAYAGQVPQEKGGFDVITSPPA